MRSFPVAVAFSFIAASLRRNLELYNNIADNLSKTRWEFGLRFNRGFQRANDLDCGRASRRRKRFVVRSDEKVTAFLELESVICPCGKLD